MFGNEIHLVQPRGLTAAPSDNCSPTERLSCYPERRLALVIGHLTGIHSGKPVISSCCTCDSEVSLSVNAAPPPNSSLLVFDIAISRFLRRLSFGGLLN